MTTALLPIFKKPSDGLKTPADPLTLFKGRGEPCCLGLYGAPYRAFGATE